MALDRQPWPWEIQKPFFLTTLGHMCKTILTIHNFRVWPTFYTKLACNTSYACIFNHSLRFILSLLVVCKVSLISHWGCESKKHRLTSKILWMWGRILKIYIKSNNIFDWSVCPYSLRVWRGLGIHRNCMRSSKREIVCSWKTVKTWKKYRPMKQTRVFLECSFD